MINQGAPSVLSVHCVPVRYEFEPASPGKAVEECLKTLERCQVYLLIVGLQYGISPSGDVNDNARRYPLKNRVGSFILPSLFQGLKSEYRI